MSVRSRTRYLGSLLVIGTLPILGCGASFDSADDRSLAANPNPVTLTAALLGEIVPVAITVRHATGDGSITVTGAVLESKSGDLTLEPVAPTVLALDESLVVTVRYAPSDGVADFGSVRVTATDLPDLVIPVEAAAPVALLRSLPNPLDFGDVPVTTTVQRDLLIENYGTLATTVTAVGLDADAGSPMRLTSVPELPTLLEPGARLAVTIAYTPEPGLNDGAHHAVLRVRTEEISTDRTSVSVSGYARMPWLRVDPPAVAFGWLQPGNAVTKPISLANDGTRAITVSRFELLRPANSPAPSVTLVGAPAVPFTLGPGEAISLVARFAPDATGLGPALGQLEIESDDPGPSPVRIVPISGGSAVPTLRILPDEVLDFGVVATYHRHERTVRLLNEGGLPLRIDSATIDDETSAAGFTVAAAPAWPIVLAPGGEAQIRLSHENLGGDEGVVFGTFTVGSQDPAAPTASLALRARHSAFPLCAPRFDPASVEFGTVALGTVVDRVLTVTNEGSLPCVYKSVTYSDCTSGTGVCSTILGQSSTFSQSPTGVPPDAGAVLLYGDSVTLPIRFHPNGDPGPRAALPIVTFGKGLLSEGYVQFPSPFGGVPSVLRGSAGDSGILATPGGIVFDLTTVGCSSQAGMVAVTRFGEAPLALGQVALVGCDDAFTVAPLSLPATLTAEVPVDVAVHFTPTTAGPSECEAHFHASPADGGTAVVKLFGVAAETPARQDIFHQVGALAVDILFVVDSSGSMGDEQGALITGFQALVEAATTWDVDFQIAVITTDADEIGVMRRPFATKSAPWTFGAAASVGTKGSGDERGLLTASMALSPSNLVDTGIACVSEGDCPSQTRCIGGFCGGENRGFMRDGALLAIIIVSDEDEHSCETEVAAFVEAFQALKPPGLVKGYAIVGDPPSDEVPTGGCGGGSNVCATCDDGCYQLGWGPKQGAESGRRYLEAIELLGGRWYSICEFGSDAAPILTGIGQDAFTPANRFVLTEFPQPATLAVSVDGTPCADGWSYDAATNEVVFAAGSVCFPGPTAAVVVRYDAACGAVP